MRGLFFKVFIILWIMQSLIFVISTALIVRHHFDSPDVFFDAMHSGLRSEGECCRIRNWGLRGDAHACQRW
jgi:hypothetical protein